MSKINNGALESQVEKRLVGMVQARGGLARKFTSPNQRGVPDRIVIWPEGVVHFVELKRTYGKLTKLQQHEQTKLKNLGCQVFTLYGIGDVEEYVKKYGG
jgi:hypothetical protein